jgi:hypothetical protein
MTLTMTNWLQFALTSLQAVPWLTLPPKYAVVGNILIGAIQGIIANQASKSDPTTGDKIAK